MGAFKAVGADLEATAGLEPGALAKLAGLI
jgi:hypothetical protein